MIELEARCIQAYTALLNRSILFDHEFIISVGSIPRCRHGRREQSRTSGKRKFHAVFTLILAADDGNGGSVLLLQFIQCRIIGNVFHCYTLPDSKGRETLGIHGTIHLVRFRRNFVCAFCQIAEAPEKPYGIGIDLIIAETVTGLVPALHAGIGRIAARCYADRIRQIGFDGFIFIVSGQSHKRICPGISIHIDLGDIVIAPVPPLRERLVCRQIFYFTGKNRAFC